MERTIELWENVTEMFRVSNVEPLTMATTPTYPQQDTIVHATLLNLPDGEHGYLCFYNGKRYFLFPSQVVLVNA